jgi:hypothetical protein
VTFQGKSELWSHKTGLIDMKVKEIDHPVNIPTKCGSKWQNGFREENKGRHRGWTTSDGNFSFGQRDVISFFTLVTNK